MSIVIGFTKWNKIEGDEPRMKSLNGFSSLGPLQGHSLVERSAVV